MRDRAQTEAPARRGRPGYDQAAVLRRAIEVFNRQGYDGTSMEDLAKDLGLTKSAIYHHVPSKEHLLAAALDEALEGLAAAIDAALDPTPGVRAVDRLRTAVHQSVVVLIDHLPAVTLLLRVRGNSELELTALARRRHFDDQLATLVRAACQEGTVRDDLPPELTSKLLFGMVNSGRVVPPRRAGRCRRAGGGGDDDGLRRTEGVATRSRPPTARVTSKQGPPRRRCRPSRPSAAAAVRTGSPGYRALSAFTDRMVSNTLGATGDVATEGSGL